MKNLILFFLILFTQTLFSQNHKNMTDTIAKLFSDEDYDYQIVTIKSDTDYQTIAARLYFPNTKTIHKEYIRIDKKTYRYWENDSLNENRLIANGNLIGNPDIVIEEHSDTIQQIDPITYDVWSIYLKHFTLEKEGKWFESDSVFTFEGYYKNNKREGKWTKFERDIEKSFDQRDLIYENGTLVSEIQLNLVKRGDINAIKKGIIGNWDLERNREEIKIGSILNLKKFGSVFIFDENGSYRGWGSSKEKNTCTWSINDAFVLEVKRAKNVERYQLLAVFDDHIVMKIIKL